MKYKLELTENQITELEINVSLRVDELDNLVEESEAAVEWHDDPKTHEASVDMLKTRKNEQRAMKQVLKKIHKYYTQGDE